MPKSFRVVYNFSNETILRCFCVNESNIDLMFVDGIAETNDETLANYIKQNCSKLFDVTEIKVEPVVEAVPEKKEEWKLVDEGVKVEKEDSPKAKPAIYTDPKKVTKYKKKKPGRKPKPK